METVGYNTEWSQELRLEESAREYVKASMLIEILKHWLFYANAEVQITDVNLDTIFDTSVGYDLAGIQSLPIRRWLKTMQNASPIIEEFRHEIPAEFETYRDLPFRSKISDSITLSTFHGTPADEIEKIVRFLLEDMGFHVIVKMNPPMLGKELLEDLLHDKLGYTGITVNPKAYEVNIRFSEAAAMMRRLQDVAARNGKTVGVKFGNTLVTSSMPMTVSSKLASPTKALVFVSYCKMASAKVILPSPSSISYIILGNMLLSFKIYAVPPVISSSV